jgi:hypothetical protein
LFTLRVRERKLISLLGKRIVFVVSHVELNVAAHPAIGARAELWMLWVDDANPPTTNAAMSEVSSKVG